MAGLNINLVLLFAAVCLGSESPHDDERSGLRRQAILNRLLNESRYDPSISPDFEEDTPTTVYIQMFIQNIYSVSESDMDFSIDLFFRQKWVDKRLSFESNQTTDWLELDNKLMLKVWVPDTYFANEKRAHAHDVTIPNKMMHLYQNGTVLYSMRLSLTLSCSMKLQKYPLDDQLCPVMVESYAYTIDNIIFKWYPVGGVMMLDGVEIPQFLPKTSIMSKQCKKEYAGHFSCLVTHIQLTRKVGYYVVQVFIPSILIVVLSWVSFWVDHDAVPARISLGVLTVLTMTTQSAGARQSLPHVSYIKAIDVWMSMCLMFVFVALLEFAYVNLLSRKRHVYIREQTEMLPLVGGARTLVVCSCGQTKASKRELDEMEIQATKFRARRVDKISRVVFPACFLIFNVVFWFYYSFVKPDP